MPGTVCETTCVQVYLSACLNRESVWWEEQADFYF